MVRKKADTKRNETRKKTKGNTNEGGYSSIPRKKGQTREPSYSNVRGRKIPKRK